MSRWFLVWVMFIAATCLGALQISQEAATIAVALVDEIQTTEPVILQVDAGEWTSSLEQELLSRLLAKGMDVRMNAASSASPEPDSLANTPNLAAYGIDRALLLKIGLNLKWEQRSSTGFFSYHSQRVPVYSFTTSQISLPGWRIVKQTSYDFYRPNNQQTDNSGLRLKWFEPLIASAAIVSLIFLLWNFN